MEFEFTDINDYEYLCPGGWQSGDHFQKLVEKFLKKNDLIFCLLEIATIPKKAKPVIGERYLYSNLSRNDGDKLLGRYEEIIDEVKTKFKFPISGFEEWYKRQTYILNKSNKNIEFEFPKFNPPNWDQTPETQENKKSEKDEYLSNKKEKLTEKNIKEYLSYYAQILYSDDIFNFAQYPNYCIIVRPISARQGNTIIPLGNLYLHFATMEQKSNEFYSQFISEFIYVWLNRKGVEIIHVIEDKAIKEAEKERKKHYPTLPYTNKDKRELIEQYLDSIYNNDQYFANLEVELDRIKENLIPILLRFRCEYELENFNCELNFLRTYLGKNKYALPQDILGNENKLNNDLFFGVTIRRHVSLLKILLFGFKPIDVKRFFLIPNYENIVVLENDALDTDAGRSNTYSWFLKNLYLSVPEHRKHVQGGGYVTDITKVQTEIIQNCSAEEISFLNSCIEFIREKISTDSQAVETMNILCHSRFKI